MVGKISEQVKTRRGLGRKKVGKRLVTLKVQRYLQFWAQTVMD